MNKKNIDLSDIKEMDLDKTSSFTDLMSRSKRKNREIEKKEENNSNDDIIDMVSERKKSTKDLTLELEKAKEEYSKSSKEEDLNKTQILDLTRQMKFNFEETKKENNKQKKKGVSPLNIVGEINLLCIGYYIYLLAFTNYEETETNYILSGSIIVLLVLLFGLSVVTGKKVNKFFMILNVLAIITFIAFNIYTLMY